MARFSSVLSALCATGLALLVALLGAAALADEADQPVMVPLASSPGSVKVDVGVSSGKEAEKSDPMLDSVQQIDKNVQDIRDGVRVLSSKRVGDKEVQIIERPRVVDGIKVRSVERRVVKLEKSVKELDSKVTGVTKEVKRLRDETIPALSGRVDTLETDLGGVKTTVDDLVVSNNATVATVKDHTSRLDTADRRFDRHADSLKRYAIGIWVVAALAFVALLLALRRRGGGAERPRRSKGAEEGYVSPRLRGSEEHGHVRPSGREPEDEGVSRLRVPINLRRREPEEPLRVRREDIPPEEPMRIGPEDIEPEVRLGPEDFPPPPAGERGGLPDAPDRLPSATQ